MCLESFSDERKRGGCPKPVCGVCNFLSFSSKPEFQWLFVFYVVIMIVRKIMNAYVADVVLCYLLDTKSVFLTKNLD